MLVFQITNTTAYYEKTKTHISKIFLQNLRDLIILASNSKWFILKQAIRALMPKNEWHNNENMSWIYLSILPRTVKSVKQSHIQSLYGHIQQFSIVYSNMYWNPL